MKESCITPVLEPQGTERHAKRDNNTQYLLYRHEAMISVKPYYSYFVDFSILNETSCFQLQLLLRDVYETSYFLLSLTLPQL